MTIESVMKWLESQETGRWHVVSLELFSDGSWQTMSVTAEKKEVSFEGDTLEELEELINDGKRIKNRTIS